MYLLATIHQNDTLLTRIAEASVQTATNTTLGTFDWGSFIIAAIALLVSFFSLYYAIVTLRVSRSALYSQERTEKNTRKISFELQSELLSALMAEIYDRFARISAAHIYLDTHHYTSFPSQKFFSDLKISPTYIQDASDVLENNNIYIELAILKEKICDYNVLLQTYFETIANSENTWEIREDVLESNLLSLTEMVQAVNHLFCSYYSNTGGDNIQRILSMPVADFKDIPTYPVYHNVVLKGNSSLNMFATHFIQCILKDKEYTLNVTSVVSEDLILLLSRRIAEYLKTLDIWFHDFDVNKDKAYLPTWSGLLLPMPSRNKKEKFNYGSIELYMYDCELRLCCSKYDLVSPSVTISDNDRNVTLDFIEQKDYYGIKTLYYYIALNANSETLNHILKSEYITIRYQPAHMPSIISNNEEAYKLYQVTFSGEEFTKNIYCPRMTSAAFEITDKVIDDFIMKYSSPTSKPIDNDNGTYEICENDEGEILLFIPPKIGEPVNPRLVLDYGNNCLLYRSKESTVIIGKLEPDVAKRIMNAPQIFIAEIKGECVERVYYAPIVTIKSIESLLI